jgi:hypothetical protein
MTVYILVFYVISDGIKFTTISERVLVDSRMVSPTYEGSLNLKVEYQITSAYLLQKKKKNL